MAAAPFGAGLTVKVTTPPATGSTGLIAVTVTASGLVNAAPVAHGLRSAAGDHRMRMNPWLWNAPMSGVGLDGGKPRWSVVTPGIVVPESRAALPGSKGMVSVEPP